MALLYINTGTSPNKGDGDTIRLAFEKVNYNFEIVKGLSLLATTDTVATLTNLTIQGTLDILGTASFTTKVLTLANHSSNSTGAGLVVFDQTAPASILYNSNAGTWNFNKPILAPTIYSNSKPVLTSDALGDISFTNDIGSDSVVLQTSGANENIRIEPNGTGQLIISNSSILFDNGFNNAPSQHLLYSAPNALPVGLGIGFTNNSLRIVGDATTVGTVADFGLYSGVNNTWTSVALIDHAGTITASSINVNSIIINNRSLQISSPVNLTIDGSPVLPYISSFVPFSSTAFGTPGQLAYNNSNLFVCTTNSSWLKVIGLTGDQWNTEALFIGTYTLTLSTVSNVILINDIQPSAGTYLMNGNSIASLDSIGTLTVPGLLSTGTIYQGTAFDGNIYSDTGIRVDTNTNSYAQSIFINHSIGVNASTDIVLMNSSGTDLTNFIDLGINGINYNSAIYDITHAGDGYLFNNGGNLVLGTQTPNTSLIFHAGGTTVNDSGGSLSASAWTFNRSVLVTVDAPSSPLNFTVQNAATTGDSRSEFQAVDSTLMNFVKLGIVTGGLGAGFGPVRRDESYLFSSGIGDTFHIGNQSSLAFYASTATSILNPVYDPPAFFIDHEHKLSILDRSLLPYEHETYDLGSATTAWANLYANTATISNLISSIITGPGGMGGNAVLQAPSSNAAVMQNNSGFNELYVQDDGLHIRLSESNAGIVFHGWDFNLDGSLTFPNTTIQTTAYNISYNIPASSTSTGIIGQLATTGTNLYVCIAPNSWLKFSGTTF